MAFPTLSEGCAVQIDVQYEDATLRTPFEAGYRYTREKHSRNRKTFKVKYTVKEDDKDLILEHWNEVKGSISFDWTNPKDGLTYTVRYMKPPTLPILGKFPNHYYIDLLMEEV